MNLKATYTVEQLVIKLQYIDLESDGITAMWTSIPNRITIAVNDVIHNQLFVFTSVFGMLAFFSVTLELILDIP